VFALPDFLSHKSKPQIVVNAILFALLAASFQAIAQLVLEIEF
jgi:hypothetical protein